MYQCNMSTPPEADAKTWHRTASEDLWERTLNQIPTRLGRMAYLARLLNPETERYEHHGLNAVFGEKAAEEALLHSHGEALESFLSLSLLDQRDDVARYTVALPQSSRRVLESWERNMGYNAFLPQAASIAQRELFDANIRLIVKHLRDEAGDGEGQQAP